MQIYNCKLRDDQWQMLEPHIAASHFPHTQGTNNRLFIEGVMFIVSNHFGWETLPPEFGKWHATYVRFRRWTHYGMWHSLAQSSIVDDSLHLVLKEIAHYGDTYLRRQKRRRERAIERFLQKFTTQN